MHGQQLATRRSRKNLNAFKFETLFTKSVDLYLQKLLSDSTETFLILKKNKNILLTRGETRKNYKTYKIYNF